MKIKLLFLPDYGCLLPGLFLLGHEYILPLGDLKLVPPAYHVFQHSYRKLDPGFGLPPYVEFQGYPLMFLRAAVGFPCLDQSRCPNTKITKL